MDTVILTVGPVYTAVSYSDNFATYRKNDINKLLGQTLRARPDGFQFSPIYKNHMWDGYIKLWKSNKFPTGLLDMALDILNRYAEELEYTVKLESLFYGFKEGRILNEHAAIYFRDIYTRDDFLNGYKLRDYQSFALQELLNHRRGVAWMATNSGKTIIIAGMCQSLASLHTLILTNKKELLYQTSEVIEHATGIEVGKIGDGNLEFDKSITVAMIQTLWSHINSDEGKRFASAQSCLIIDECHHTSSKTMMDVVMNIPAVYRFGFSGTPLKDDVLADLQLKAATGEVLFRINNDQLIKEGYSAIPEIRIYDVYNIKEALTYPEAYDRYIVNNTVRNNIIITNAHKAFDAGRVVLILVDRIEHQKLLYSHYTKSYSPDTITCLNGSHATDYRKEQLEAMRSGTPHIYIATGILEEGVDVPAIDVMILANAGKSYVKLMQRIGRGMRKKEKANKVIIIDFNDIGNKYLERHSKERLDTYTKEGFTVNHYDKF